MPSCVVYDSENVARHSVSKKNNNNKKHTIMKKILFMLLFILAGAQTMKAQEAYAEFDTDTYWLKFYYDDKKASRQVLLSR